MLGERDWEQFGKNRYRQQIACEQAFTWVGAGEIKACPHGLSFWDTCSPTKFLIGEIWEHIIDILSRDLCLLLMSAKIC